MTVGANMPVLNPHRGATAYVAAAPNAVARVYVAGAIAWTRRTAEENADGRRVRPGNHTGQLELGAGASATRRSWMFETLGGVGFGRTDATACAFDAGDGLGSGDCSTWFDSKSWFVRGLVQETVGLHVQDLVWGNGVRLSVLHHRFSSAFGAPSDQDNWGTTFEYLQVLRFGVDWGKVELGVHVPIILSSGKLGELGAQDDVRGESVLVQHGLRATIGVQADVSRLWRRPPPTARPAD